MLSRVSLPSDPYGSLEGYLFAASVPPQGGGRGWINPSKADTSPGQSVPAPKITASAAHPGRKSNNTIPYTRVCTHDAARLAGRPGHPCFVARSHSAQAVVGTEKRSVMCSLEALNQRLSKRDDGRTTLAFGPNNDPLYTLWKVSEIKEWTLDGVVLGNPDLSNTNPTSDLVDGRLEGTQTMNVCVQGIASTINVFQANQGVHMGLAALDEVFLGLFATTKKDHWSFHYHPFGVQALRQPELGLLKNHGTLVGAWKLGKVVDTKAAVGGWGAKSGASEHRITLNVGIEWIPVMPVFAEHPCDINGNYCFAPTLFVRYGNEEPMECPSTMLNELHNDAPAAPAPAPAAPAAAPAAPAPAAPEPSSSSEPAAPDAKTQQRAVEDMTSFFATMQTNFDQVRNWANALIASKKEVTEDDMKKLLPVYEYMTLKWATDNDEAVQFAKTRSAEVSEPLREHVQLLELLGAALSRGRTL